MTLSPSPIRKIYLVLSARSLSYSRCCMASLARNALEALDVTLITDDTDDKSQLEEVIALLNVPSSQRWQVFDKADADARAEKLYAGHPAIRAFREGHPCWRKITDPPLFAQPGEEMIILDPDVYFPNRFAFEPTPESGLLLMWQHPNCLLPEDVVRQAFEAGIEMADHTDIGVAHARFPLDWDELERLITTLGGTAMPRSMHVESIIWAALAMSMGGGYLDPTRWHCYHNSVASRIKRKRGQGWVDAIASLDLASFKCIHGGGEAKNWFPDAERAGVLSPGATLAQPAPVRPYRPFPRTKFERKFTLRRLAGRLGLYRLVGS